MAHWLPGQEATTGHTPCGLEVGHLINRNSSPRIAAHYRDYWGVIQPWTWSGTKEFGAEWQLESQLNSSSELSWTHTRFHLCPALCFLFWSKLHASESDLQNQKTFNYLESKEPENSKESKLLCCFSRLSLSQTQRGNEMIWLFNFWEISKDWSRFVQSPIVSLTINRTENSIWHIIDTKNLLKEWSAIMLSVHRLVAGLKYSKSLDLREEGEACQVTSLSASLTSVWASVSSGLLPF